MADFNERKVQAADFQGNNIQSIDSTTVVGQADWLKKQFDKSTEEVIAPKLNGLIEDLQDEQAATQIGTPALLIGGVQTVAEQLAYLFETITNVSSGSVPDGSITDEKLSNAAGQLKATVAALGAAKASLESPNFTGTPTAPTADEGNNSTQIANTAFCENLVAPMNAHILNGNVHVTSDLKGKWDGHVVDDAIHVTGNFKNDLIDHMANDTVHFTENEKPLFEQIANRPEPMKLLWSGNFDSGTITIDGFSKYHVFYIGISGNNTRVLALKEPGNNPRLRGGNFFTTSGGVTYFTDVSCTCDGDNVTYAAVTERNITGAGNISSSSDNANAITAIYGVL